MKITDPFELTTQHRQKLIVVLACLFFSFNFYSQADPKPVLVYNFNDHEIKEKDNKITPRTQDVGLTYDRFGNDESALQIMGTENSYLSLGVSPLLKSTEMSISMWVRVNNRIFIGKGYDAIPILTTKNGEGFDYINAITMAYDCYSHRFGFNSTRDSLHEVMILDTDSIVYNKWYHFVAVCNNKFLAFYIDGKLIGKTPKAFETKFLLTDSMVIGHTASTKNVRFLRGVVDDIKIYHSSLSDEDVLRLYNDPNPNEDHRFLKLIYRFSAIILGLILIIILVIVRSRRTLKKQKEELQLANRISDLELKVVKAQMNPHFISNCLAAIQDLNYSQNTEKAGLYIAKFSFFLRQILDYSDENYISAAEEIEMIHLFVELEQLRFKNGFKFDLTVDEALIPEDLLVPSLITQPFIENAIWHGLLPLKEQRPPRLTVKFYYRNGFPVIEIEDNGVGRDPYKKRIRKSKGTQLVIDKINTLNRLSKTSNYKIDIIDLTDGSGKKSGTKIIIHLDVLKE